MENIAYCNDTVAKGHTEAQDELGHAANTALPDDEATMAPEAQDQAPEGLANNGKEDKKERIKVDGLKAEKDAVFKLLASDPDAEPLAIAVDLDIPDERALRLWVAWHSTKTKRRITRLNKLTGLLKDWFKSANGDPLATDAPMNVELEDNRAIITLYEKKANS